MRVITPGSSLTHVFWTRVKSKDTVTARFTGKTTVTPVTDVSKNAVFVTVRIDSSVTTSANLPGTLELLVNGTVVNSESFRAPVTSQEPVAVPTSANGLIAGTNATEQPIPVKRIAYTAGSANNDTWVIAYDPNNVNDASPKRWTSWFNERGLLRLQQSGDTKWDVPLRIFGPHDNTGFGSNIIEVHRQRTTGTPVHVFGVNATGRIRTSLYTWTDIPLNTTKFNNDTSGDYDKAQVRWVSDDTLEFRGGRVVVTGGTLSVGDVIGTLPPGFWPFKRKVITVINASGGVSPVNISHIDGTMVNQRNSASATWLSLDSIRVN